jgi:cation transport protein ChaC
MSEPASYEVLESVYGPLDREFWVFGYGSLMWRPDFAFVEEQAARLNGYHRCLCVYSINYRGTPENPGLVLGLDQGGCCIGRAFRVAACDAVGALTALHAREMVHNTYKAKWLPVALDCGRGEKVTALTYVVRRDHPQYAGKLNIEETARLILAGRGKRGTALEYVRNTVTHLDAMGIKNGPLHEVLKVAERQD